MIAYFVHDGRKQSDLFVLPDMGCAVAVTPDRFETFIAPNPVFAQWSGDTCGDLSPEEMGTVVATRDELGDVCVLDHDLWRQRMDFYTTGG